MSEFNDIFNLDKQYYMNTFGDRTPLCFERGEGMCLYTTDGAEYTDYFAGIAVNALGYNYKPLTEALCEQATKLLHISNLYYTENQAQLAKTLVESSCADKVFFANSGTEAVEGTIKLIKKYHYNIGNTKKHEIITLKNSFHGRTMGAVAATGQAKYQAPYQPLLHKFVHVSPNDCGELKNAVTSETAAALIEFVQGEGGVIPLDKEYVRLIRQLCDEYDIPFAADEIQTGIGRCGKLFAYELYDTEPDIIALAKGLGGGIPIGAICAKEKYASAFSPGDHGTTFGGNPFATRAGIVVMNELINNGLLKNANEVGEYLGQRLNGISSERIKQVRGMGLMYGIELDGVSANDIRLALLEKRCITGTAGGNTLRITPPLIITKADVDKLIIALEEVLDL